MVHNLAKCIGNKVLLYCDGTLVIELYKCPAGFLTRETCWSVLSNTYKILSTLFFNYLIIRKMYSNYKLFNTFYSFSKEKKQQHSRERHNCQLFTISKKLLNQKYFKPFYSMCKKPKMSCTTYPKTSYFSIINLFENLIKFKNIINHFFNSMIKYRNVRKKSVK